MYFFNIKVALIWERDSTYIFTVGTGVTGNDTGGPGSVWFPRHLKKKKRIFIFLELTPA